MPATARPSPPGTASQWQTITSRTGPSIAKRTAPQGQAPSPRHAGSAGEQAVEVVVRRPPAAGDADQAGVRDLAHVHAGVVERLDELGRLAATGRKATRVERSPSAGLTTSTRVGEELPAALGDGGGMIEGPGRAAVERRQQARERRRGPPARVEARRTGLRRELPVRLVLGLREVARRGDPQAAPDRRRRARRSSPARRATSDRRS